MGMMGMGGPVLRHVMDDTDTDTAGNQSKFPSGVAGEFSGHFMNGHVLGAFGAEMMEDSRRQVGLLSGDPDLESLSWLMRVVRSAPPSFVCRACRQLGGASPLSSPMAAKD